MTSSRTSSTPAQSGANKAAEPELRFSFFQRLILAIVPRMAWAFVRLLGSTWRYEVIAEEGAAPVLYGQKAGAEIYCFWHRCILLGTEYYRHSRSVIIISQSFDGELVTRFIRLFGYDAVRGSSSNRGHEGLLGLKRVIESGKSAIFTADGPRGPVYRTKMGPIKLAQLTGAPIGAFHLEPERAWVLRSWDHFLIPKPFTRVCVSWAQWTHVRSDARAEELDAKREELNAAIERARLRALAHFGKAAE